MSLYLKKFPGANFCVFAEAYLFNCIAGQVNIDMWCLFLNFIYVIVILLLQPVQQEAYPS
jgi:hypothetical protein